MTDKAALKFYPWHREGMVALIEKSSGVATSVDSNPQVRAKILTEINGVTKALELCGPGDVLGIDARQIVRTEPPAFSRNFETNFRPYIEFDRPDFPWVFTPLKSDGNKLVPWLCLIVLKKEDVESFKNNSSKALPVLICKKNKLPDLSDAACWAHVQHAGSGEIQAADDAESLSRLVAPIVSEDGSGELSPTTAYQAFVVPVFNVGCEAGLKQERLSDKLMWAWHHVSPAPPEEKVELPVYYSWEFSTSEGGDFESLARRLDSWPAPPELGKLKLNISNPSDKIDLGDGATLDFSGALISPKAISHDSLWPNNTVPSSTFETALSGRFSGEEELSPPMYGRWHAKVDDVEKAPAWLRQLNFDPGLRVAAGLGSQVIRNRQESLMKVAWEQVEQVEDANRVLRQAQLAREIHKVTHKRVTALEPEAFIQFSSMAHSSMLVNDNNNNDITVKALINNSQLPDQFLHSSFRRLLRPSNLRRKSIEGTLGKTVISRFSEQDSLVDMLNEKSPGGIQTVGSMFQGSHLPADDVKGLSVFGRLKKEGVMINPNAPKPEIAIATGGMGGRRQLLFNNLNMPTIDAVTPVAPSQPVLLASPQPIVLEYSPIRTLETQPVGGVPADVTTADTQSTVAVTPDRMKSLFKAEAKLQDEVTITPLNVGKLADQLKSGFQTEENINSFISGRVKFGNGDEARKVDRPHADSLAPIMAGPVFDEPMYDDLTAINDNLLMPGIEMVPQNSVSLLVCNSSFVNAFMVGLNFEMARELLWRGYPTDQRGTYFNKFWPRYSLEGNDTGLITNWKKNDLMTGHRGDAESPSSMAVFLIRGELLQRYPGAVVSAVRARPDGEYRKPETEVEQFPVFSGKLGNDIWFFGFNLSVSEMLSIKGTGDRYVQAGWYLLIEQQATEVEFSAVKAEQHAYTSIENPVRLYFHADELLGDNNDAE